MKDTGYCVVLAFGPQPISFFKNAAKLAGDNAVTDPNLARMAGANFAVGQPDDIAALKKLLEPAAVAKAEEENAAGLSKDAIQWMATGERGLSSETLFSYLTGHDIQSKSYRNFFPGDPDDLRRCMLLLEQCPGLKPNLPRIVQAGPVWAALFARWDELTATFEAECPSWRGRNWSAPKTFALMKEITTTAGGF